MFEPAISALIQAPRFPPDEPYVFSGSRQDRALDALEIARTNLRLLDAAAIGPEMVEAKAAVLDRLGEALGQLRAAEYTRLERNDCAMRTYSPLYGNNLWAARKCDGDAP